MIDLADVPAVVVVRFTARVDRHGPDECWPWTSTRTRNGYGQITFGHVAIRAHRLAHYLATGEQPENVCHSCDYPPCCNPAHLFGGSSAENQADKASKGRAAMGEANQGGGKLTENDVRVIRRLLGEGLSKTDIGRQFNVSRTEIGHIDRGKHWSHVT